MTKSLFGTEKEYLTKAGKIILCSDIMPEYYLLRPYLCGNENQSHIQKLVKPEYKTACLVASSGNTLFEVVRNGITDITAVDISELQMLILKLRFASVQALNNGEFEKFLLDFKANGFLSSATFEKLVKKKLTDYETACFWSEFLKKFPPQVIASCYIKGGLEHTDIYTCKRMLPWIKNGGNYNAMRRNLMKAKIELQICDIIEFLIKHPERKFDYIDFSNILVYIYQECSENDFTRISEALDKVKIIYEKNLNDGGTFVIDYMFGTNVKDLENPNLNLNPVQQELRDLYIRVYEQLLKEFPIETMEFPRAAQATALTGPNDMVVFTKK